jgi:5-methylcytosine-specific restriction protein A
VVLADLVDHIVPISAGGEVLDERNLQSLCNACHAVKTQEDIKKYGPVVWDPRMKQQG